MIDQLLEMFSYPFMVRAMLAGACIAVSLSLLGVPMVLKRYSMIGDGLSHVAFGALAVASALHFSPLVVGIPVVMLASVLLLRISEKSMLKGDSAIALISTSALAIGVTAVSVTKGMNVDVWNYLFGSVLSLTDADVLTGFFLAALTAAVYTLFYNRIFLCTFDENFATAIGIRAGRYNLIMALTTSLVIILGMRMVGSLLISSLIVFPAMSSMRVFRSFRAVSVGAVLIAFVSTLAGIVLSYLGNTPAGSSIVLCNLAVYLLFGILKLLRHNRNSGML